MLRLLVLLLGAASFCAAPAVHAQPAPARPSAPADSLRADSLRADSLRRTEADEPGARPVRATLPDSLSPQEQAALLTTGSTALGEYHEAYYVLDYLNRGLVEPAAPPNLQTPQATLEYFVRTGRDERFEQAAYALNLNLLPDDEQASEAAPLAERLFYVLDKQLGFDWEGLPDRPDGLSSAPAPGTNPLAGQPRRSIALGTLALDGRNVTLRMQRVKIDDRAPAWVFSAQTVENIPPLYQQYGPGPIDRFMPRWARTEVLGQTALWAWLALLASAVAACLLALWVRRRARDRLAESDARWARGMARTVATPIAVAFAVLLLYLVATLALGLPALVTTPLLVLVIVAFIWLTMRAVEYLTEYIARDEITDVTELSKGEGEQQQRWLTYLSVGRRVLLFIVLLLGIGILISQFQSLQTLGISLMASAGVATVLLGIAAQPLLGNIVAGLQIALTKPARIGDSVLFEGHWGYVEDITYTYILIQTWDQRRLVVPLRYFVTHPFENWTMRDAHLIKPIHLHVDYTVDVDRIRQKFDALLRTSELWDGEKEPTVQVTAVGDETIEVRALCSAKDASSAWDLHCMLREELVAFVRDLEDGRHLPRRRVVVLDEPAGSPTTDATAREEPVTSSDGTLEA